MVFQGDSALFAFAKRGLVHGQKGHVCREGSDTAYGYVRVFLLIHQS
jgi:hypothetical protein